MKKLNETNERTISLLLVRLVVLFVGALIISNILANEMVDIGPLSIDGGILLFPITYVLSDVFSEVYGYVWTRRVTNMASLMNILFFTLVFICIKLPHPDWFEAIHFELALASSFRIVVASIISYWLGDFANDQIFERMRLHNDSSNQFAFRAILSSLGGELVDSTFFVMLAFYASIPNNEIIPMIFSNVVLKTSYEIVILPLTIFVTKKIKKLEGVDL